MKMQRVNKYQYNKFYFNRWVIFFMKKKYSELDKTLQFSESISRSYLCFNVLTVNRLKETFSDE